MNQKNLNKIKVSRRNLIKSFAGIPFLKGFFERAETSDEEPIFKGEAPRGRFLEKWKERGWFKEAKHYVSIGKNVQCRLCPNNCFLAPNDRSRCRTRVNKDGKLYTVAYNNPCSLNLDPVEKKPLYHFLPASATLSFAIAGCTLRCLNCQNWEISQAFPENTKDILSPPINLEDLNFNDARKHIFRLNATPQAIVNLAKINNWSSLSYTYSEPTAWYEYLYETAIEAHKQKIRNILVSCGNINQKPLEELCEFIDAANIDLKVFDETVYRRLNSGGLDTVLNTLKTLHKNNVWFEITNLIVPTYCDDLETIDKMCAWIADNIGNNYPLHFSRFHAAHKLMHLPSTTTSTLLKAREIAQKRGLNHVYIGNAPEIEEAGTTWCPNCARVIVLRRGYNIVSKNIDEQGLCNYCQTKISGIWS